MTQRVLINVVEDLPVRDKDGCSLLLRSGLSPAVRSLPVVRGRCGCCHNSSVTELPCSREFSKGGDAPHCPISLLCPVLFPLLFNHCYPKGKANPCEAGQENRGHSVLFFQHGNSCCSTTSQWLSLALERTLFCLMQNSLQIHPCSSPPG